MLNEVTVTKSGEILELSAMEKELAERHFAEFAKAAWKVIEPQNEMVWGWHLDAIAEHLEAVSKHEIRKLILNVPPRHSKPLEEDTLVLMDYGVYKKIKNIKIGDFVITHKGRAGKVSEITYQGELDVLEIKTHTARKVITAYDHPFLTPSGWVQAKDLDIGNTLGLVISQKTHPLFKKKVFEEYRLIGYFIGDGCTVKAGNSSCASSIICFDPTQIKDIIHCIKKMGFDYSDGMLSNRGIIGVKKGVRDWLRSKEIDLAGKGSRTKRVPKFVFESSNEQISHFLGAYFSCDGTVTKKGNKRKDLYINITSVNLGLMEDAQHLLLRLGINARIRRRVTTKSSYKEGTVYYILDITSHDNTAKFKKRIPIFSKKLERLKEWDVKRTEFNNHLIPDKIVSIIPLKGKKKCYCLSVDKDHSFMANDIAVHNSSFLAVMWPAWTWIKEPGIKWLFTSYALDLSIRDSVKCRRLILSPWYQEKWGDKFHIVDDQSQKVRFENNYGGYRLASSVGGKNTGEGGDFVIVDDPNNIREIESEIVRLSTNRWWDEVMSSRINNPETTGARVIIMQRSHEDDLTGHVLGKEGSDYVYLSLPARYEVDRPKKLQTRTPLIWTNPVTKKKEPFKDPRTKEGDPLCPGRHGEIALGELEIDLGEYAWSGQYQQNPHPRGGGMFKIENFILIDDINPKEIVTSVRYWDKAATAAREEDVNAKRTAGTLMHKLRDGTFLVGDLVKGKWSADVREKRMKQTADLDGRKVTIIIEQEPGSGGKESGQNSVRNLAGFVCYLDRVTGKKEVRAEPYCSQVAVGNVKIFKRDWTRAFIQEHEPFPYGKYSDMVDSAAGAFIYLAKTKKAGTWGTRR